MSNRFRCAEPMERRAQVLLVLLASHGVPPLEFKPSYSVGGPVARASKAREGARVRAEGKLARYAQGARSSAARAPLAPQPPHSTRCMWRQVAPRAQRAHRRA